ncbi:unnamed protein product [Symbiodinium natans]|uniref:Uncharacterized protein n=1 Tax=Symbiodinium natans TaxID=878477 RepID=A0A812HIB3_9DINO|nr:unnamed protein product [Symbiodinium natans]
MAIGIDFGTSRSCVAAWTGGEEITILPNEYGKRTTPSFVGYAQKEWFLGNAARIMSIRNYESTVFHSRQLLGRCWDDPVVQRAVKMWPFKVAKGERDQPTFEVSAQGESMAFLPEHVSAFLLAKLHLAGLRSAGEASFVVMTVPAAFNHLQHRAIEDVASIAGVQVRQFLPAPSAAALAYALHENLPEEQHVLVIDLGAGSIDVALVHISKGFLDILGSAGNDHFGGNELDNCLVGCCLDEFHHLHGKDASRDLQAMARLRLQCEQAKCKLSITEEAYIELDAFVDGLDYCKKLTRADFEKLAAEWFHKILEVVASCLEDAGVARDAVDAVLPVGGATRIPKVREILADYFGKQPYSGLDPDEVVARGAAAQAAILSGTFRGGSPAIRPSLPWNLLLEKHTSERRVVIARNTRLPVQSCCTLEPSDVSWHRHSEAGTTRSCLWLYQDSVFFGAVVFDRTPTKAFELHFGCDMHCRITITVGFPGEDPDSSPEARFERARSGLSAAELAELTRKVSLWKKEYLQQDPVIMNRLRDVQDDPTYWAIVVGQLKSFYQDIKHDLDDYCQSHHRDEEKTHICHGYPKISAGSDVTIQGLASSKLNGQSGLCEQWDYGSRFWSVRLPSGRVANINAANLKCKCMGSTLVGHGRMRHRCWQEGDQHIAQPLRANMHTVVDVFIRAFTSGTQGFALMLNWRSPMKACVFISHSWNEDFGQFVAVVRSSVPGHVPVWICSFALPQNAPIGSMLKQDIQSSPFARALCGTRMVLLIVDDVRDGRVETLSRAWCVFECHLAVKKQVPIRVRGPNMSLNFYENLLQAVKELDLRTCSASDENDLRRILEEVERCDKGHFDAINKNVKDAISWTIHEILLIIRANK